MNFNCRPIEPNDLEHICSFPKNADELYFVYPKAIYPLTREQLQSAIDSRQNSTVLTYNNSVIGFANFYHWEDQGCCKIGNFIVKPDYRGQGAGSFLLTHMMTLAKAAYSATHIEISCFNTNTQALLLYVRRGFVPFHIEQRSDQNDHAIALIHMRKSA